ncbi:hypothetical protein [Bradyrhizobium sp. RDI18]|uniref:hypothetical protein n=1 Tax=Bradyrhizobium sp. RDI18 TaxID=3367400 RepID=UPI0037187966
MRVVGAARCVLRAVVVARGRVAIDQRREAVVSGGRIGSGRADLAAAFWKDAFADTSDVTLTTVTLALSSRLPFSKDRASRRGKKYYVISNT